MTLTHSVIAFLPFDFFIFLSSQYHSTYAFRLICWQIGFQCSWPANRYYISMWLWNSLWLVWCCLFSQRAQLSMMASFCVTTFPIILIVLYNYSQYLYYDSRIANTMMYLHALSYIHFKNIQYTTNSNLLLFRNSQNREFCA